MPGDLVHGKEVINHFLEKVHFDFAFILVGESVPLVVNDIVRVEVRVNHVVVIDDIVGQTVFLAGQRGGVLEVPTGFVEVDEVVESADVEFVSFDFEVF